MRLVLLSVHARTAAIIASTPRILMADRERCEAELSPDIVEALHQEGVLVHPLLDAAEGMLDDLAMPIKFQASPSGELASIYSFEKWSAVPSIQSCPCGEKISISIVSLGEPELVRNVRIGTFRVCDGHVRSVRSQTLGDCSTNAARAARNECNLSFQFLRHCFSHIPLISLFADLVAYVGRAAALAVSR
jgi:hypothetical protein